MNDWVIYKYPFWCWQKARPGSFVPRKYHILKGRGEGVEEEEEEKQEDALLFFSYDDDIPLASG